MISRSKNYYKLALSILLLGIMLQPVAMQAYPYGLAARPLYMLVKNRKKKNQQKTSEFVQAEIAGLNVAIWKPQKINTSIPLVIFSHGFGGSNTQSKFIMQAFAGAGYLVMAPNHKDSMANGVKKERPPESFRQPANWTDNMYRDRAEDIIRLLNALKKDNAWMRMIDWSKVALCGHSLGGYTVLGLGGAWPSWKQSGIKAILALSPYCEPFVLNGDLANIQVPVMYQGGTRDIGITPTIKNLRGALSKTSSPADFVEFDKLGHLGWTNFNHDQKEQKLINYYCVAFFDKYVRGEFSAQPELKYPGVSDLETK